MKNMYLVPIDIKLKQTSVIPKFIQYDAGRLRFRLTDNGTIINLSGLTKAEITLKRKADSVVFNEIMTVVTESGNEYLQYDFKGSEMTKTGGLEVAVSVFFETDKISTLPFLVEIVTDLQGEIEQEAVQEVSALRRLINEVTDLKSTVIADTQSLNDRLTGDFADLSDMVTEAETLREQNETQRQIDHQVRMDDVDEVVADTAYNSPYNATTQYKKNNIVTYNGSSYIAKQDTIGNAPPIDHTSVGNTHWGQVGRKGADGNGTVVRRVQKFVSTANQTTFNLSNSYTQFTGMIDVEIEGIPQYSPENFIELSPTSIQFTEPLVAGLDVVVKYFSEAQPLPSDLNQIVTNHTGRLNNQESRIQSNTVQLAETNDSLEFKRDKTVKIPSSDLDTSSESSKIQPENLSDGVKAMIAGTAPVSPGLAVREATSEKIAQNAINFDHLGVVEKSSNGFNKDNVTPGFSFSGTTGELVANSTFNAGDFEVIEPNSNYIASGVGRWVLYDYLKQFISSGTSASFATPSNAYFARYAVSNASLATAQVNKGTSLLPYAEYYRKFKEPIKQGLEIKPTALSVDENALKEDVVTPHNVVSFKKSNNIFNKNNLLVGKSIQLSDGSIIDSPTRSVTNGLEPIKPNQIYSKSLSSLYISFFDKNGKRIRTITSNTSDTTFTTDARTAYWQCSALNTSVDSLMINEGAVLLPYEDFYYELQSSAKYPLKIANNVEGTGGVTENEINAILASRQKPFRKEDYTKSTYASIVSSLPSTDCTIEELGLGSDGVNMLYGISYGDLENKPVIFIVGTQHGSEWQATHYPLDFMTRIAKSQYYDSLMIQNLRDTFSFYLVVSACPWGYDNDSYTNFNGVNLNRNWDNNWESYSSSSPGQFKGTAPFSEPETQIVRDKILELEPYLSIDCHTSGNTPGGIDVGGSAYTHRNFLESIHNLIYDTFNDASLNVQLWNAGSGPTMVGWVKSQSGLPTISTLLERPNYDGNYGLTALFALSIGAYKKYQEDIS